MILREPTRTVARRARPPSRTTPVPGLAVYGCSLAEAAAFRAAAPRFGVHPVVTGAALSEHNTALAYGNRCVSVDHKTAVTDRMLQALRRAGVEYVSTRSVGSDHIDVACAAELGITVGTVAYSPDSVADYTLMLMLMAVRDAKAMIRRTDAHDYRLSAVRGRELRDLTVGVVGTGRIGTAVVDRLRGFGSRVLTSGGRPGASAERVRLDELLALSDIVTLHTPLTPDTHHLLDEDRIAAMKRGAYLVNTGRGGLVDTEALVRALAAGRLGGAALDVVEGETGVFYTDHRDTPVANEPLRRLQRMPNVVISPHTAYYTDHALRDIVENSLAGCVEFAKGERK